MPAGFGALRDDGVDAVLLEPDRLLHNGRGRDHNAAGGLDPPKQRLIRQAKMEADDFGLQLLNQFTHRGIEGAAVGGVDRCRRIEPQLSIVGPKPELPAGLSPRIGIDGFVTKEVHVERRRHTLPDDVDLLARLLRREQRTWQRSERPALGRCDHQVRIHDPGHRRQHNGKFGLDEIEESAVRPHGLLALVMGKLAAASLPRPVVRLAPRDTGELCNAPPPDAPAPQRNNGPYRLDQAKRPGTLQKPVSRTERAGGCEGRDEPMTPIFQRVAHQHRGNGEQPK